VEAGAISYIDTALADAYRADLPRYRRALRELDQYTREATGHAFVELGPDQQDAVLQDLEAGRTSVIQDGAAFFDMVRDHVLEGIFGDPQYGGNHDLIGWKLVAFPGQRTGYSDAYINHVVDLPPVARWEEEQ
jgi:gluconate 2-dehydrogenase gamma chain